MRRGLLLAALLVGCGKEGAPAAPFPDAPLIVISLDTLRADDTSMLGGPKKISPVLEEFAKSSVLFTQARAQAPHTAPSHMSLFTSTFPSIHMVQNVQHVEGKGPLILELPKAIPTMAEILKAAGFATIGLTDGGNLVPPHGFARGFDEYTHDLAGVESQVADGKRWIEKLSQPDAGRFFLFWHTYQIHAPYCPPASYIENWAKAKYDGPLRERLASLEGLSFKERFGKLKTVFWKDRETFGWPEASFLHGLYRGSIAYTDDELKQLFAAMQEAGLYERAIIVVLSDHGEEFFEHGLWQHDQLYEECLRVPLIVRLPGGRNGGRAIDTPVGLIDVMPTVLELMGVATDARMHGRSLVPALLGNEPLPALPVFSELRSDREGGPLHDWMVGVYFNGMKYIYDEYRGPSKGERFAYLFDLAKDADEHNNLVGKGGPILKSFQDMYAAWKLIIDSGGNLEQLKGDVTPEMREQLEQLGYIQATPP